MFDSSLEQVSKCSLVCTNDTGTHARILIWSFETPTTDSFYFQVRHLDLKKEKEVPREDVVRFLLEAMAIQFRNPNIWNLNLSY